MNLTPNGADAHNDAQKPAIESTDQPFATPINQPSTMPVAQSAVPSIDHSVTALTDRPTVRQRVAAWGVHAFTMSGVVWALLAFHALYRDDVRGMWGWLAIALIVDALDGTLARKARVREVVPWFDGVVLDLVVDYLTWTFIPAAFIAYHLNVGPEPWPIIVAAVICVSSMFCYCNKGMKSNDNYFVGFPAAWNVVAVCLWILDLPTWANLLVVAIFSVLTVVPWTYLHPFRVRKLMIPNIVAVAVWIATTAIIVATDKGNDTMVTVLWWVTGLWFLLVSALRTLHGEEPAKTSPAA
ncbi:CDP-alcohol phosphatidyltransferase family protein [Devriesea agamarum]|uniref:CDP-alcohol phosphatidyltransferase family protein n=1 Tax=Devriesea agamarum TaxID=472569 RepID=UPI000AABD989|nr:hypothetical protein [Devriesea agamarum]